MLSIFGLALTACSGNVVASKVTPSPDDDLPTIVNEPYQPDEVEDGCEVVDEGEIVVFSLALTQEFPIYECDTDGGTPSDGTDGGTTPPPQEETDGGTTPPPQDEVDAGTPPGDAGDGGTPTEEETDAGVPNGDIDGGTPPQEGSDGGCAHDGDDAGQDEEEPLLCNRKITIIAHSGETTTYFDEVLNCTFIVENDAVNTRVVRSCDKETETAMPKVFAEVGSSGQLKLILTTPHRCGHFHEL